MQNQNLKKIFSFILFLLLSIYIFAAAGGGGGGSSGGGDGGGSGGGEIIFWIIRILFEIIWRLPFPINVIVLVIIAAAIYYFYKTSQASSGLNSIPTSSYSASKKDIALPQSFVSKNTDFNVSLFKEKVRTSFKEIQNAWMLQDLSSVRKWISDGMYQRFNTQFLMMKQIDQTNEISDINIHNVFIDDVETDGVFDILHVGIQYTMYDGFESGKYTQLNDGGPSSLTEYWSFIKKSGVKEKDIYHSNNCPNCGGQLPANGGETARCPYCSTITYLGDYDWVLAEITQADDYLNSNSKFEKQGKFAQRILSQIKNKNDFSLQNLEDKASNGYMQMMTSFMLKKPETARRFVADNLYAKIESKIKTEPNYLFFRLYLNHVTSFDYFQKDNKDNIVLALKRSQQRIFIANPDKPTFENVISSQNEVLILSRNINAQMPKGSLYAHSCPNCGAPIKDTVDTNCTYCTAQLNSTEFEWIISEWMTAAEYETWKKTDAPTLANNKKLDDLDELYDVRDYAFNNMMVMIAADGVFAKEEMEYANMIAKKWNYSTDKLQGLLDMAKQKELVIRMPENPKKKEKIIAQMEKVANLDGNISIEEAKILNDLKSVNW